MKEHKKSKAKTKSQANKSIREHQPNAAGIDLGAEEIWVAVAAERDQNPVRRRLTGHAPGALELPTYKSASLQVPNTLCARTVVKKN